MPVLADITDDDRPYLVADLAVGHDDNISHEDQQDFSKDRPSGPAVGDRVDVFWDDTGEVYFSAVNAQADDGRVTIQYDNGNIESAVGMIGVHRTPSETEGALPAHLNARALQQ